MGGFFFAVHQAGNSSGSEGVIVKHRFIRFIFNLFNNIIVNIELAKR
jgi:hypothetical protein